MIHIFQFYKKHWRIPKRYYTAGTRKAFQYWDREITSQVGFVDGKKLFLPIDKKDKVQVKNTAAVILQDVIGYNSAQTKREIERNSKSNHFPDWFREQQLANAQSMNPELAVFNRQLRKWEFEIFSLQRNTDGDFDIHLHYSPNHFQIGEPKRNDHTLYSLKKNEPIKISINGKSDFSMTSRRERSYSEYEYIIEYLGEIESVEMRELSTIEVNKIIPSTFDKHIDLRKILY